MSTLTNISKKLGGWYLTFFVVFALLLIGLFLRSYNLDSLPIFADEAIYVRWSQVMRVDATLRFLPLSDGKQPLFMWVVIPFFKIFSDPLIAGRFVSVLTGIGTIVGSFVLTYILFERKKIAIVAAMLAALTPYLVFFDRMALVDSMLAMFAVWISIGTFLLAKTHRLDVAMITGGLLGGALLTKSPAIFFVIAFFVSQIILYKKQEKLSHSISILKQTILSFVSLFIAIGIQNIMRLGPNFHMLSSRNADYVYPLTHVFENAFDPFVPFIHRSFEWYWILGPSALFVLFCLSVYILLTNKRKRELLFLLVWGAMPVVVSAEFAKVFTARYILYSVSFLCVCSAASLLSVKLQKVVYIVIGLFIVQAVYLNYFILFNPQRAHLPSGERSGYLEEWTSGVGIYEASRYLRDQNQKNNGKKIVVGTEGYFGTLPDGLQLYLNDVPDITVIGVGIDLKEIPQSLSESVKAGNDTYLLINDSRLKMSPQDTSMVQVLAYEKANRSEGTKEFNTLGPKETIYLFKLH
jgi:4-amino-4-deoxy-L-arabinose transferase-like glycosyltransferase